MSEDTRVRELLRRIQETDGTPEDVCRDCPELLPEVRARWAKLRALDAGLDEFFAVADDVEPEQGPDPTPEFPGYAVAERLGAGGMGVVYKARDLARDRVVALKLVHPHLRRLPGFVERLTREAELGRKVVHENVVRTLGLAFDKSRDPARQALVTEFVQGQTLRALLAEMGRLPEPLCRHVGREIANGLAAIHAAGAVHRDLKPDNVIVSTQTSDGGEARHAVKVMDLGVARVLDGTAALSQPGAFVGSLRYAAPEQLRDGHAVDGRADIHALGLVLFELATGTHAIAAAGRSPRRASSIAPNVSPFFDEFVAQCLLENPDDRFGRASEMVRILDEGESSAWWAIRTVAMEKRTPTALGRVLGRRETAIVGRDPELRRLADLFERAGAGDGRVVLVEGEAGIGKSRVVEEFAGSLLRDARAGVLFGGYAPSGAATATEAFATALRQHFGGADLEAALAPHLAPAEDLVGPFATLLRGGAPLAGPSALPKQALHTAFVRVVQSLARARPIVVVIEDLHFSPDEGRELFAAVASAVAGHPVLLVGTARRSVDQRWTAELTRLSHVSRLSIGRLGADDVEAVLGELLGSLDVAAGMAAKLWDRTDGNPYFVFETLRDLRETQALARRADGAWAVTRPLAELRVAPSIGDLIRARMASLAAEEREMLRVAACCGFEFDPLLVGEVLGIDRFALFRRLGEIETSHRLVRAEGRRYAFDHHSVQEVVHDAMSDVERETFHAAIGATLETRATARRPPSEVPAAECVPLADHFLRGAVGERALPYLDRALKHLLDGFHHDSVNRLAARALAAEGLVAGVERCKMALLQARALATLGRAVDETQVLAEAVRTARAVGDLSLLATALVETATADYRTSHSHGAGAALEEAARLCESAGDRSGEAAVLRNLGVMYLEHMRMDDAIAHFERSRAICREIGDRRGEGQATGNLGAALRTIGRVDEATRLNKEQVAIATEVGDQQARVRGMSNLGTALLAEGRFDESVELQEDCLRTARRFGDRNTEATTLCSLGIALKATGRLGDAKARLERSLALMSEIDSRRGVALVAVCLGAVCLSAGAHETATLHLRRAIEVAQAAGVPMAEIQAGVFLGEIAAEERRFDDALTLLDRYVALAGEVRLHETVALAHLRRGGVLADLGRATEAAAALDRAASVALEGGARSLLIAAVAERTRQPGGDARRAAELLDEHAALIEVGERVRANWRLWQASASPRRLAEAKRLLRFMQEHAPADARMAMIENVAVHREVAAAPEPPVTAGAPRRA